MFHDFRFAFRTLLRNPGFTVVSILTLALGIGANSSIFTLINGTILKQLPYRDPQRLMLLRLTTSDSGEMSEMPWSYPKFRTLRQVDRNFEQLAGFNAEDMNLTGGAGPERVRVETVSATYFPILGVQAMRGRTFTADEDAVPKRNPVALIAYGLWQRRFAGANSAIGSKIIVNDVPLTVVGVLPAGFEGLSGRVDVWAPMMMVPALSYPEALDERWSHWFDVIGRRRDGVTPEKAAAGMTIVGKQVDAAHPAPNDTVQWSASVVSLRDARSDPFVRKSLFVLLGAVGFVLLIACANVANLLLARAASRRREIAIRLAIGAHRWRLVRQFLAESILLSVMGGFAALLLTSFTAQALRAIRPERTAAWGIHGTELFDLGSIGIDWRVFLFTLALSVVTGIVFGLIPAIGASRPEVSQLRAVRSNGRMLLAAGEVGLALMLLVGAGLMLRSFARMVSVDTGFDMRSVVTFRIDPSPNKYNRRTAPDLHRRIGERLAALPGVEAVGFDKCTPLSAACNGSIVMRVDGRALPEASPIGVHFVNPDYFNTLRIPLLRGRGFTLRDRGEAPKTILVNRTAAEQLWPGQNPVGRMLEVGVGYFRDQQAEVVGVVGDVRYGRVEQPVAPAIYIPDYQYTAPHSLVFVRTSRAATGPLLNEIRRAILEVDPDLPLFEAKTMSERVADATSKTRFAAALLAVFAGLALTLALIGIYGVMSYVVRQRTREIGVRMAVGASSRDVLRNVLGQALTVTIAGVLAGVAGALVLVRVLQTLLYEVSPRDTGTFLVAPLLLVAAGVIASYLPARRASLVDPMKALRHE
ncbi:MAG TPA: ABC transporter permease [Thermoanaerobaculia bacterium]|nr:ABC transporter permease [Thermoanaerobaculia bacterium]